MSAAYDSGKERRGGRGVNWSDKRLPASPHKSRRASSMLPKSFSSLETNPATVSEILETQVARIFIQRKEPGPSGLCTPIRPERRRTPRRPLPIPLFVYGHTPEGQPFYEETFTTTVNVHGGSMRMETSVQLGQRLLVTNHENDSAQPCIVVFVGTRLGGGVDVAFSFTAAMPSFWGNSAAGKFSAVEMEWDPMNLRSLSK
jgi:hypothetical protein